MAFQEVNLLQKNDKTAWDMLKRTGAHENSNKPSYAIIDMYWRSQDDQEHLFLYRRYVGDRWRCWGQGIRQTRLKKPWHWLVFWNLIMLIFNRTNNISDTKNQPLGTVLCLRSVRIRRFRCIQLCTRCGHFMKERTGGNQIKPGYFLKVSKVNLNVKKWQIETFTTNAGTKAFNSRNRPFSFTPIVWWIWLKAWDQALIAFFERCEGAKLIVWIYVAQPSPPWPMARSKKQLSCKGSFVKWVALEVYEIGLSSCHEPRCQRDAFCWWIYSPVSPNRHFEAIERYATVSLKFWNWSIIGL